MTKDYPYGKHRLPHTPDNSSSQQIPSQGSVRAGTERGAYYNPYSDTDYCTEQSSGIVLGELVGIRFWFVKWLADPKRGLKPFPRLCSENGAHWEPNCPLECPNPPGYAWTIHSPRDDTHPPGIHAYKPGSVSFIDHSFLYQTLPNEQWVMGKVALWGSVVEHRQGYRAQYAYPLGLVPGKVQNPLYQARFERLLIEYNLVRLTAEDLATGKTGTQ